MKNYGFKPNKLKPEDYVFGDRNIEADILCPNGQWDQYLPEKELQKKNEFETYNCTGFGILNCIETILNLKYGREHNYSDRYVGVLAGTGKRGGNSPHNVAEVVRKKGSIKDKLLPFKMNINKTEEYYSPDPMTRELIEKGIKWLKDYEFKHDWVFVNDYSGKRQEELKEALKFSPIGISVYAWMFDDRGVYIKQNQNDNHWVMLYGYKDGEYWKIFDSYENDRKKLDWNYNFGFAKRYKLKKRKEGKKRLIDIIRKYICKKLYQM